MRGKFVAESALSRWKRFQFASILERDFLCSAMLLIRGSAAQRQLSEHAQTVAAITVALATKSKAWYRELVWGFFVFIG
jgi:hypothetical protein